MFLHLGKYKYKLSHTVILESLLSNLSLTCIHFTGFCIFKHHLQSRNNPSKHQPSEYGRGIIRKCSFILLNIMEAKKTLLLLDFEFFLFLIKKTIHVIFQTNRIVSSFLPSFLLPSCLCCLHPSLCSQIR